MEIPSEVIMLLMYSIALMMILLGVAIGFRRIYAKLNRILHLLGADEHNKHNVSYRQNKRHNIFPEQSSLTPPENTNRYNPNEQNQNHTYYRALAHIKSIPNIIISKQLNANKTFATDT